LQAVIDIIQQVSIRSREAKEAVQTELAIALAKLNDVDLSQFQHNVTQALKEAKGDADALKLALGGALQEELLRLGLTAEQVGTKFTAEGQKIIATFSDISENAQATGRQIQLAFAQSLTKVTTGGEVEALERKLKAAFDAGRIGSDEFQTAMEAAARKLVSLETEAARSAASLDGVGKSGETAAQRAAAALDETRNALIAQARTVQQQIDQFAQQGQQAPAELRAAYKQLDDQIQGLGVQIEKLAPAYELAGAAGEKSAQKQSRAIGDIFNGIDKQTADVTKKAEKNFTEWGDAADKAALATQGITVNTSNANLAMDKLNDFAKETYQSFKAISQAAAELDTKLTLDLGKHLDSPFGPGGSTSGFEAAYAAIAKAAELVNQQIIQQRVELKNLVDQTNKIGTESVEDFNKFGGAVNFTNEHLQDTIERIKTGTYDAGLLGQQELVPLLAALEAAKARVDALDAATKAATQQLIDLSQQLQDERDQQNGNQTDIENRRFQKQVQQINDLAAKADEAGKAQAKRDLELAEQIHQKKLKDIADQQAAQNGGSGGGGSSGSGSGKSGAGATGGGGFSGGGSGGGGFSGSGAQPSAQPHVTNFHVDLTNTIVVGANKADVGKALADIILPALKQAQSLSVKPILGP
jgi:hypothetical protein